MYDQLLLPTDGSPEMEPVIDHALSLAAVHDGTVHGLYVLDTASLSGVPMDVSFETVADGLREEGRMALGTVEQRAREAGVPVETNLADGSPARDIVSYAEGHGCDVIVMGTHGRSGVGRLLLGSVAERVVRSSPVPVITVRVGDPTVTPDGEEPARGGGGRSGHDPDPGSEPDGGE